MVVQLFVDGGEVKRVRLSLSVCLVIRLGSGSVGQLMDRLMDRLMDHGRALFVYPYIRIDVSSSIFSGN